MMNAETDELQRVKPIEPMPSIAEIHAMTCSLLRKFQSKEKREAEDMNDRKAAWLSVVLEKGLGNVNERDRRFAEKYLEEGVRYSLFWYYKPEIAEFIRQQRIRYGLPVNN